MHWAAAGLYLRVQRTPGVQLVVVVGWGGGGGIPTPAPPFFVIARTIEMN